MGLWSCLIPSLVLAIYGLIDVSETARQAIAKMFLLRPLMQLIELVQSESNMAILLVKVC